VTGDIRVKKGIIICFMGVDGSGKTTLAKGLEKELSRTGYKCRYLWWLSAEQSIVRKALRFFARPASNTPETPAIKSTYFPEGKKPSLFVSMYQYLVLLDYTGQLFYKVWLPKKLGNTIICDRYIYDTVLAFSIEFGYDDKKFSRLFDFFYRLSPKPDVFFIINIPLEVAFSRKNDIPSVDFLRKPDIMYKDLGKKLNAKQLDGTRNIEQLNALVLEEIHKHGVNDD
jgi:dTMP kinase